MRTKALFLTAAAIAAGLASASAQVYSVNVVGYANVAMPEGFSIAANPLNASNNNVTNVIGSQLPANSQVYTWDGVTYSSSTYTKNKAGTATNWSAAIDLSPGKGFWVSIPSGSGSKTNTFVGEVLQGSITNQNILPGGGFALLGSQVPQGGGITTPLGYQPKLNDQVYVYNGGYVSSTFAKNKAGTATNWAPSEPVIQVGQGFWLNSAAGATWVRNFTVQ